MFALCLVAASFEAAAQERLSTTRVFTEPNGLRFYVDGQMYRSTQAFIWPAGSKHTLAIEPTQYPYDGHRQTFSGWSDNTGQMTSSAESVVITADPNVTTFKASFSTEYQVKILFHQCDMQRPETCRPPGTVYVNSVPSTVDYEGWFAPNSNLVLYASPNSGYVFSGWGPPAGNSPSAGWTTTIKGPLNFSNIFAPAKQVTLDSDPTDLLVAPDATPTRTPAVMDWGEGTRHTLGVVSPQTERLNSSKTWVFSHWTNGAKMNDVYLVKDANIPVTLTAKFVPGVGASFVTEPVGLKLKIEGRDNWPAYNFVWGVGMKYQVSAPAEQTDSRGRRYVFKGWSNGGPATQEVAITEAHVATGFRLVATYEALSQFTVDTLPAGLPILIDGKECRGTCSLDKPAGTKVEISAPASIQLTDTNRMEFMRWSDGGNATRVVTLGGDAPTKLTAAYKSLYKLLASSEPATGAVFTTQPPSADGFFDANTSVSVTADSKAGFRFRRWEGDLSGTFRTGQIEMTAPRAVRAFLDIVPWADEAGARNAASDETSEPVVAPGSIACIRGANLAGSTESGPANPLAQTIGGVIVRLNDRLLPLVSVAPDEIRFLVPSDLAEGVYYVYARWGTTGEVRVPLTVSRNAPGLFHTKVDTLSYGSAVGEDGSPVTVDSPARLGSRITLLGTGFGPYDKTSIDGFAIPGGIPFNLSDPIELFSADRRIDVEWAGAVAGKVGTAAVRFVLPSDVITSDGVVPLRVRVNGRESNTVLLRVE